MDGRRVFGTSNPTKEDGDLSRPGLCFGAFRRFRQRKLPGDAFEFLSVVVMLSLYSASALILRTLLDSLQGRPPLMFADTGHFGWGQRMRCQKGSATDKRCDILYALKVTPSCVAYVCSLCQADEPKHGNGTAEVPEGGHGHGFLCGGCIWALHETGRLLGMKFHDEPMQSYAYLCGGRRFALGPCLTVNMAISASG